MKIVLYLTLFISSFCVAQQNFQQALQKYNDKSIDYITVEELHQEIEKTNLVSIFDAREVEEYQVSHLPNAIFVGYKNFDPNLVQKKVPAKNELIIVYCTIGVRSEKVGKKLKEAGYLNVKNLYGGILEWRNKGFKVYNLQSQLTDSVHTYNKKWSRYLHQGKSVF